MNLQFVCPKVEDTQALAKALGAACRGGEVIAFASDLGGGKTAFVKGLAVGMGVTDVVQSPTFTISQIHQAARGLELHHFDFYRLDDPGIMSAELSESLAQPNAVVAVEWGDIVQQIIPREHIAITLRIGPADERVIGLDVPDKYMDIVAALKKYQEAA